MSQTILEAPRPVRRDGPHLEGQTRDRNAAPSVVLVVDDNEADSQMTKMILEEVADCHCETHAKGPAALARLTRLRRAGVRTFMIADLRLPDMEGTELLEQAKKVDPELQAVLISGLVLPEATPGGVEILEKPLDYAAYRRMVLDVAGRWDLVRRPVA